MNAGIHYQRKIIAFLPRLTLVWIPSTLIDFLEPYLLPVSPLLTVTVMMLLLIGLTFPLIMAVWHFYTKPDMSTLGQAIVAGKLGSCLVLIAALPAWIVAPLTTDAEHAQALRTFIFFGGLTGLWVLLKCREMERLL